MSITKSNKLAQNEGSGYSIWVVPPAPKFKPLYQMIRALSSKYSTPNFKPHITLLGSIKESKPIILQRMAMLSRELAPFQVNLGFLREERAEPSYFKLLFIDADSPGLMAANTLANKRFGRRTSRPYSPHLSLIYGNLTFQDRVDAMAEAAAMNKQGHELSQPIFSNLSFIANTISLYRTSGQVGEWRKIRDFTLLRNA